MPPKQNPLIAFLSELLQRLFAKSPLFFEIWQWISGAAAAVTGIPAIFTALGINLPSPFNMFESKAVAIASAVVLFMAMLPTATPTVSVTSDGKVLKSTDAAKLPFTANNEVVRAQDAQIPNSTLSMSQIKTTPTK